MFSPKKTGLCPLAPNLVPLFVAFWSMRIDNGTRCCRSHHSTEFILRHLSPRIAMKLVLREPRRNNGSYMGFIWRLSKEDPSCFPFDPISALTRKKRFLLFLMGVDDDDFGDGKKGFV